jgi:predicted transcriptional regulator
MSSEDYLRAFVLRGENRLKVLKELAKGEKTQADIHHATDMYRTHVRRTLIELEEKELVRCLNPKDRIYKLYVLTDKGKRFLRLLK